MGGQVLGGGVIVLVAALLWLVYLLPTWHSRYQYDANERNAVRLNQALRVLAETSETPEEVRIELNARTALAQQRLARRTLAERESAGLESARRELAQARSLPAARQARARRRARLTTMTIGLASVAMAVWGAWHLIQTGSQVALWTSVVLAVTCGLLLRRMARVGARVPARTESPAEGSARVAMMQDLEMDGAVTQGWTPRELPRPLVASAGSRASAILDVADEHAALRHARVEQAMRERIAQQSPPSIEERRRARAAAEKADARAFDAMGSVGDDEIEAHVRRMLERRSAAS